MHVSQLSCGAHAGLKVCASLYPLISSPPPNLEIIKQESANWSKNEVAVDVLWVYSMFDVVCLCLQRETLLRQLETNQLDIDATLEELSVQQETEDQNYDM